jgi:hypothetical protein
MTEPRTGQLFGEQSSCRLILASTTPEFHPGAEPIAAYASSYPIMAKTAVEGDGATRSEMITFSKID